VQRFLELLLSPKGRIGRLTCVVSLTALVIIQVSLLGVALTTLQDYPEGTYRWAGYGLWALAIALLWPFCVLVVKRFHDIGWQTWKALPLLGLYSWIVAWPVGFATMLLQSVFAMIGVVMTAESDDPDVVSRWVLYIYTILPIVIALVLFAYALVLAFMPGDRKESHDGSAPSV
jgi:uncharacterized membrane protein YhaH (DUF805 family)